MSRDQRSSHASRFSQTADHSLNHARQQWFSNKVLSSCPQTLDREWPRRTRLLRDVGPLPLARPRWDSRGTGPVVRLSAGPSAPGPAPGPLVSPSGLRANQPGVMPRRRHSARQKSGGQGPGHNGAIVGLQSVDFQPSSSPSTLAPFPHSRPLPGSHDPTASFSASARRKQHSES